MNEYKFKDLYIGLNARFSVCINQESMNLFCELSGDINPLHVNGEYAKDLGFKNRVVYGLLTASYYSQLVGVHLPGKYAILQGINIHFMKPVYLDDILSISGEISYINKAFKQIEIKSIIKNQHGDKVSRATIKSGIFI